MAVRRITLDGREISEAGGKSLHGAVGEDGFRQVLVTRKNPLTNIYEVVPRREYKTAPLAGTARIMPYQTELEDGGVKEKLLMKDISLIHERFLSGFPEVTGKEAVLDERLDWIQFKSFPLPEFALIEGEKVPYRTRCDDIVIVLSGYPEFPPIGVHFHGKSPNLPVYEAALSGHVFEKVEGQDSEYRKLVKSLHVKGWHWICLHYAGNRWKFNPLDVEAGDCLYKYVLMLHGRLAGWF